MAGIFSSIVRQSMSQLTVQSTRRTFLTSSRHFAESVKVSPSNFDKKLMLSAKMYKSLDEIPEMVSADKIRKARDIGRIRGATYMMLATVVGCILMIWSGRRSRDAGDSLSKRGIQWQQEMREIGIKEEEAKRKAQEASQSS